MGRKKTGILQHFPENSASAVVDWMCETQSLGGHHTRVLYKYVCKMGSG
jgi:hypothetical protein